MTSRLGKKSRSSGPAAVMQSLEPRQLMSVVYVDVNAPGPAHNGRSWLHAYTDLQQALTTAAAGETIDVAEGTYRPTEGTDRTVSFQLEAAWRSTAGLPVIPRQRPASAT
jgi:hypothetical protein